ncbi:MAG: hypothetical protein COY68_00025 [Candidatus Levybacteria bacterium CG_4_10_14_0_8_um_filter_35_23]|nr:MAG: hypothetical protein COY68_00025 [Candidatus Levybacteria bacterium CG_4_10_14_0_8_um_filter_35_23]PJC54180.1 MAG: hypothetical protein CO028_03870 [Candidatus Levybacteria bacterium CG_4_9_14_0_2_um_filter_35_21]
MSLKEQLVSSQQEFSMQKLERIKAYTAVKDAIIARISNGPKYSEDNPFKSTVTHTHRFRWSSVETTLTCGRKDTKESWIYVPKAIDIIAGGTFGSDNKGIIHYFLDNHGNLLKKAKITDRLTHPSEQKKGKFELVDAEEANLLASYIDNPRDREVSIPLYKIWTGRPVVAEKA